MSPSYPDDAETIADLGDTLIVDPDHAADLTATDKGAKQHIGPFQVHEILGAGGMGVVYAATSSSGTRAAVKVLSTRPTHKDTDRFAREATVRIRHPNVVEMLDADVAADPPYIAFELLEGTDLQARLREAGVLSPRASVDIGLQMCAGIGAAHEAGVIHRDLKPANVFLCSDGTVKVLDFGIAYIDTVDDRLTSTNAMMGTPHYMAPEQARGDKTFDGRTDVWGAGAVLYHALTGRPPFARDSRVATLLAVVTEDPERITSVAPSVPRDLAIIVERALAKDQEDRWPTIGQMRAALEALGPLAEDADPTSLERSAAIAPGEQRIVAVLMARGVLDRDLLEREIKAREGVLVPIVGGQAIGLFGVDRLRGDEVVRAVEAGLAVRGVVEQIAVASGHVLQTGAKVSGGVVRAAEACCDAGVDGVALDVAAAHAIAGSHILREAQPGVFVVVGEKPKTLVTTHLEKLDRSAPLFGRDAEVAQIKRALRTVLDGDEAAAIAVRGPVGIGKRRLAQEAMRLLEQAPGARLLFGRAEPRGQASAFGLWCEVLTERAERGNAREGWPDLRQQRNLGERQHAVMRLVDEAIFDRRSAAVAGGFLGRLLGVEMPETSDLAAARDDPQLMQDRIRLALLDYVEGLVSEGPVGLFLEELQWADADSLGLVDELMERCRDLPLLLFTTGRPELDLSARDALDSAQQLELEGLDRLDVRDMACWIAKRQIPDSVLDALAERTGGNPLFIEQIVSALPSDSPYDTLPSELPLPLTVEAAVQSRLDHLASQEKEACRRCSVFGRPFGDEEATALGVEDAPVILKGLVAKKILAVRRRRGARRKNEYRFRSTLIQDVAYGMIVEESRKAIHARTASYLSKLPDTEPEELARHYDVAGMPRKAALHYARAAFRAARRGDSRKVDQNSARALELDTLDEAKFDLAMIRGEALQFLGAQDGWSAAIGLALEVAKTPSQRAQAQTEMVKIYLRSGMPEQAIQIAQEAERAARTAMDSGVLLLALGRLGLALTKAGRFDEAAEALATADLESENAPVHQRALIAGWQGQLFGAKGDLAGRLAAFERAVTLYERAGDPRRAAGAKVNVADLYNRVGLHERAEAALADALVEARKVHNRPIEGYALVNRAYALTMLGRLDEAQQMLASAHTIAEEIGDPQLTLYVRYYWVRAREPAGGAPRPLAEEAEAIADEAGNRFAALAVAAASRAAAVRLAMNERDRALLLSERAMSLLEQVGGVEEDEADVFATHARILQVHGRQEEAQAVLERGRSRLLAVASAIDDDELEAQLLRMPAHRSLLDATHSKEPAE